MARRLTGLASLGAASTLLLAAMRTVRTVVPNEYLSLGMHSSILLTFNDEIAAAARDGLALFLVVVALVVLSRVIRRWFLGDQRDPGDAILQRIFAACLGALVSILGVFLARNYILAHVSFPELSHPHRRILLLFVGSLIFVSSTWLMSRHHLGALAGRLLLSFGSPKRALTVASVVVFVFSVALLAEQFLVRASAHDRPNILLLVVDTLRADHVGVYGRGLELTPNIDRFAGESAIFLRTTAQGPNTINSSPCILASLYPTEHGYYDYRSRVSDQVVTLAEILRNAGYETLGISTNPHVSSRNGLGQGFDTFLEDLTWKDTDAADVNERFLEWLGADRGEPFFALLWYIDPHVPYDPPRPFVARHLDQDQRQLVSSRTKTPVSDLSEAEIGVSKLLYRAEVSYFDSEFGQLMDELERLGVKEDTMIILTSDHGEAFGEHRDVQGEPLWGHGSSLHSEQIDVPLVIRFPGGERREIFEERVNSIDILPTVLDVAGIDVGTRIKRHQHGSSLLAILDGRDAAERYSFSELISSQHGPYAMRSVQNENTKLVTTYQYKEQHFRPPLEEILSSATGAKESPLSAGSGKKLLDELRRAFSDWEDGLRAYPTSKVFFAKNEQEMLRERLEALGYIQ